MYYSICLGFILVLSTVHAQTPTFATCPSAANIGTIQPAAETVLVNSDYFIQTSKGSNVNNEVVTINGLLDTFSAVSVVNWLNLQTTGTLGLYVPPTTTSTITLQSTSASDLGLTPTPGPGCRTVLIEGLNAAGAAVTDTVFMNGATATSATANTYSFVDRLTCATVGATLANVGVISLATGPGAAAVRPVIGLSNAAFTAFGVSRSTAAAYRVPSGKTLLLTSLQADAYRAAINAGTFSGVIWIKYQLVANGPMILLDRISLDNDAQSSYSLTYELSPIRLPAGATIWAEAMWENIPTPTMLTITGILYS